MAVKSKIVKQLHEAIDAVVADATDAQALAAVAFINSLVTDEDESEDEEEETVKKPKKGKSKPAKDEDDEDEEESEEDDEESEDEDEDEEESDEEESEDDEDEEESDEEDEEESEDDDEESEDDDEDEESEDDDEDEEDEKPAKKKPAKKAAASEDDEDEGRDYKSLNEKKIIAIFKEVGIDPAAYSKFKTNKVKLLKLLKAYDANVTELKAKSLTKLTAMAKKQGVKVSFGRGRSTDAKKVTKTAEALAAAALAE